MNKLLQVIILFAWLVSPVLAAEPEQMPKPERHTIHFESAQEVIDWANRLFPSSVVDAPKITNEYLQGLDLHWSEETFRTLVDLALDDTSGYSIQLREGGFAIVLNFADPLWERYPWEGHAYLREQLLDWHEQRGWPSPTETEMGYLIRAAVTLEDFDRMLAFLENGGPPPSFQFYQLALSGGPAHKVTEADSGRLMKAWEGRRLRGLDRRDRYDQAALLRVNSFRIDQAITDVRDATEPEARTAAVHVFLNRMREMVDAAEHWNEIYRPRHPWIQDDLKPWYQGWIENPPESLSHEPEMHQFVLRLRWKWLTENPRLLRALCHGVLQRSDLGDAPVFVRNIGGFIRQNPDPSDRDPLNAGIRTLQEWEEDPEREIQRSLQSLLAARQVLYKRFEEDSEESAVTPALSSEDMQRVETEANILFAGYREEARLEREARRNRPCSLNLQSIARVKQNYSWSKNLSDGHILTPENEADIHDSYHYGFPACPQNGEYLIGAIGEPPSCSIHGRAEEAVPTHDE